jgi:hypothetical protein
LNETNIFAVAAERPVETVRKVAAPELNWMHIIFATEA